MKFISHRGNAFGKHPENTMAAFKDALTCPIQMIETDLRLTADGHWIISHDRTLSRVHNAENWISDWTLDELRKYGLPSLEDLLDLVDGQVELYFDIKGFCTLDHLESLLNELKKVSESKENNWNWQKFYLASFNNQIVDDLLKLLKTPDFENSKFKIGYITANDLLGVDEKLIKSLDFLSMSADFVSSRDVQTLHEKFQTQIFVYTMNDFISLQYFYYLNVDGLLTDHPELFYQL